MNDDLLTTEQLMTELGVSVKTLYRWRIRPDNPIPVEILGPRTIRYRRSTIERWLETLGRNVMSPSNKSEIVGAEEITSEGARKSGKSGRPRKRRAVAGDPQFDDESGALVCGARDGASEVRCVLWKGHDVEEYAAHNDGKGHTW